jgi:hypothetical protein
MKSCAHVKPEVESVWDYSLLNTMFDVAKMTLHPGEFVFQSADVFENSLFIFVVKSFERRARIELHRPRDDQHRQQDQRNCSAARRAVVADFRSDVAMFTATSEASNGRAP